MAMDEAEMRKRIFAIMTDTTLTEAEKAVKRQELMCGKWMQPKETNSHDSGPGDADAKQKGKADKKEDESTLLDDTLKCAICFNLCERPITGPCQHNFCLGCFKRWYAQGKKTCPTCRTSFPAKFAENPRINTVLTQAIRLAKQGVRKEPSKTYERINNADRPDEAFTTDRAQRAGRANAASGRIMVTVPNDHFGPIMPEHDPENGKGVVVGDWWKDRLDCRQWGAHFPHVAGIAGQSNVGAQSVVLSGGYEDDRDEGEWFLYTGSGGRDLSGNKRTNKEQSFDQEFTLMNEALRLSCIKGLPVRVVRSFKEKRSNYAPGAETPVRYDGVYRILRCWRKKGAQNFLMCRYLFMRCDNAPAPWSSEESGDTLRLEIPEPAQEEIDVAVGKVHAMGDNPFWNFDPVTSEWGWAKPPPPSQKSGERGDAVKKLRKKVSEHERLLKDFGCGICKKVLQDPLSMPCGHNFCKACLDARFAGEATSVVGGSGFKTLRARKVPKPCPTCKMEIGDFLSHAAVNREMQQVIDKLKQAADEARKAADEMTANKKAEGNGEEEEEEAAEGEEGEKGADDEGVGTSSRPAKRQRKRAEPAAGKNGNGKCKGEEAKEAEEKGAGDEEEADKDEEEVEEEKDEAAAEGEEQAGEKKEQEGGEGQKPAAGGPAAAAPASAPAPAAQGAASRYSVELAELQSSFPDFDEGLILGLLEDQGGDAIEVAAYLKRMKNQLAYASRTAKSPSKGGAAAKSGGKRRRGAAGGGKRKKKAEEDEEEAEEAEEGEGEDVQMGEGAGDGKQEAAGDKEVEEKEGKEAEEQQPEEEDEDFKPPPRKRVAKGKKGAKN